MGRLGNAGQYGKHPEIHLSGIGLAGYVIAAVKAHFFRYQLLDLAALLMVAVEKLQEARLGSGGSLGAQEPEAAHDIFQIRKIHHQILDPEGSPLADGGRLGRLEMGKCQGRHILILQGEFGKLRDDVHQGAVQKLQALPHLDQVRIVPHKS